MENETQRPIRLNSATPKKQRPHWHLRFEYKLATTKLKHAVFVRRHNGRRMLMRVRRNTSDFLFFSCYPQINHTKIEVSPTIHCKYKYFDSTVQRAEDRRQKVYFCRLPFAVNVKLNLFIYCRQIYRNAHNRNLTQ